MLTLKLQYFGHLMRRSDSFAKIRKYKAFYVKNKKKLIILNITLDCKRSNQSILKEINPEYSLEGLMLKLKLQYFGHLMQPFLWKALGIFIGKNPDVGKDWRWEKGTTEDQMLGWQHWFNGHEFEQTLGDSEGQGSLACCSSWGCKELDMTEQQQQ